eukprot:5806-Heterococcus_DN1.PRE.1
MDTAAATALNLMKQSAVSATPAAMKFEAIVALQWHRCLQLQRSKQSATLTPYVIAAWPYCSLQKSM